MIVKGLFALCGVVLLLATGLALSKRDWWAAVETAPMLAFLPGLYGAATWRGPS